ncbi:Coatomer subunit beta'-2 [Morella rubra]|uniref:Coatomer subunit beta'-2 n=1 Tax=Morella rubra TaxID=262757 RepID=A0A6A1VSK3_9ROSI|nr:Coatomer subunit beta'-2 [Morella rubra]
MWTVPTRAIIDAAADGSSSSSANSFCKLRLFSTPGPKERGGRGVALYNPVSLGQLLKQQVPCCLVGTLCKVCQQILNLASLTKEQGKKNVAFLCLFMLGKLEECLQLLLESNRILEAALMARSYLPSKVSEIVAIRRKDLHKVNPKATKSLADSEEYPNLFEDYLMGNESILECIVARTWKIF